MITLNGSKFAENEDEMVGSLFSSGGTCVGTAKRFKRHIKLFNIAGELVGVVNRWGVLVAASKQPSGIFYSFATIPEVGEYASYSLSVNEPKALAIGHDFNSNNELQYIYN